jgi:hypothetical protein
VAKRKEKEDFMMKCGKEKGKEDWVMKCDKEKGKGRLGD